MIQSNSLTTITILLAVLAITLKVEESRLATQRTSAAEAMLATTNAIADRDSTHNVAMENTRVAALLGDSLRLVQKQVVQAAQRGDALDQALGRERRASYVMNVATDSARAVALAAASVDSASVRRARFAVRQPPYTVRADVELWTLTDSARLLLAIALDPILLSARLVCSPPDIQGIRTATIIAGSPKWATVHFDGVEQSSDICASPALGARTQDRRVLRFPSFVFGAGRVVRPDGTGSWGMFVGIGTTVGG